MAGQKREARLAQDDPAIHDFLSRSKTLDARVKPGHDEKNRRPGAIPAFFSVVIPGRANGSALCVAR
jgi:hypothetical protein